MSNSKSMWPARANLVYVISPYWRSGTWVFDDPARGLIEEPFVCGAPEILSRLAVEAGLDPAAARRGFRLLFSAQPFPSFQREARWLRPEQGGNWYAMEELEGWLCPALFRYYDVAPEKLYVKAEAAGSPATGFSRRPQARNRCSP